MYTRKLEEKLSTQGTYMTLITRHHAYILLEPLSKGEVLWCMKQGILLNTMNVLSSCIQIEGTK